MIRKFEDESHVHTRSLQIYMVLIGLAWNRQTITYGMLSKDQMGGYGSGGILDRPLGCIMRWCEQNDLPPLTSLVVNERTGEPGPGLTSVSGRQWPSAQQSVFNLNWFSIFPPTVEQLQQAGESG